MHDDEGNIVYVEESTGRSLAHYPSWREIRQSEESFKGKNKVDDVQLNALEKLLDGDRLSCNPINELRKQEPHITTRDPFYEDNIHRYGPSIDEVEAFFESILHEDARKLPSVAASRLLSIYNDRGSGDASNLFFRFLDWALYALNNCPDTKDRIRKILKSGPQGRRYLNDVCAGRVDSEMGEAADEIMLHHRFLLKEHLLLTTGLVLASGAAAYGLTSMILQYFSK